MAHLCCRRGYWSLEESFREGKRVKKRVLEYYGKHKPFNILTDTDWQYTMRGDGAVFNEPGASLPVETVLPAQPSSAPSDTPGTESEPGGEVSGGS